jgi:hypothetical protein
MEPAASPVSSLPEKRSFFTRPLPAHLLALVYFIITSIWMTWPLVQRMANSVVGEIGDNIYFIFLIRWYEKAWLQLGISPFFHPWLNYPQGWNLASTDTSLATTLFGLPASLLYGPTFGYNFAMLVTFVLSGWAMFTWVRHLSGSTAAGLVAGTIYAFLPYRMAHFLIGHMNLSGTAWFPLYFMGLYDLLRSASRGGKLKADWKAIALTAAALGLIGFTSMYYLYMVLLISGVFGLAYVLWVDRSRLKNGAYWRSLLTRLAALGIVCLPLVALSIQPFLGLNSQGGLASRSVSYASMYSASPTDFILPSTQHFLFGQWVGAHFDRSLWIEGTLYIGVVAFILAVIAWVKRSASEHQALLKVALVIILVSFVLALGTDLHWNNQRVELPVPTFLQSMVHRDSLPIPLPALLLFEFLPFYAKMRALMRIGLFVLIFSTLMAGLGAAYLIRKAGPRRALPLTVLLIVLVFLDFYPGPYQNFAVVSARPVDTWLAQQPGQGAVAQFPFIQEEDQDQVYNTLTHGKPFIGGFFSANQPEQYQRIRPVLANFPETDPTANGKSVDLLRSLGVQWVLFDLDQYADFASLRSQVEALGMTYIDTVGSQAVFELR